jgi:hypothetical protein
VAGVHRPRDFVFVAECFNNRVQVRTPSLDFRRFIGVGELTSPTGVCANDDVVAVSEDRRRCVSVFRRRDGELLRRIGRQLGYQDGDADGLDYPYNCASCRAAAAL